MPNETEAKYVICRQKPLQIDDISNIEMRIQTRKMYRNKQNERFSLYGVSFYTEIMHCLRLLSFLIITVIEGCISYFCFYFSADNQKNKTTKYYVFRVENYRSVPAWLNWWQRNKTYHNKSYLRSSRVRYTVEASC